MLYEKMNPGENLSWCRPYRNEENDITIIVLEGKIDCIVTPEEIYTDINPYLIKYFARVLNDDYAEYSGWDDTHILLDACNEVGCADCPARFECEAMQ